MKRVAVLSLSLLLALALLFAAHAEYISGDGWWDESYSGVWNYIDDAGLAVKLPDDWSDNILGDDNNGEYVFMRDDYYITLSVAVYGNSLFDLEDAIEENGLWFDDYQYEESANLILKDDRDWYIIANDYLITAITDGAYGGTAVFTFNYDDGIGDLTPIIRRIISSVETY